MCLKVGLDSFFAEDRQIVDTWDHNTEYLGSIKCWEYLYSMSEYYIFKKVCILWNKLLQFLISLHCVDTFSESLFNNYFLLYTLF